MIASLSVSLAVTLASGALLLLFPHRMDLHCGSSTPCPVPARQAMKLGPMTLGNMVVWQPGLPALTIQLWGSSIGGLAIQTPISAAKPEQAIICTSVLWSLSMRELVNSDGTTSLHPQMIMTGIPPNSPF